MELQIDESISDIFDVFSVKKKQFVTYCISYTLIIITYYYHCFNKSFWRILKPYYGMFACESAVEAPGQDSSDGTSGDCVHPILAVEPSNPSTPPRTFKIHKQRLVS